MMRLEPVLSQVRASNEERDNITPQP